MWDDFVVKLEGRIPEEVFHYLDAETGIEHVISRNTMKFSSPLELDDPLEGSDHLISIDINEASIKYFANLDRSSDPQAPSSEEIEFQMRSNPSDFAARLRKLFSEMKKTQGIRSFSELPNINPMWGTYGKSHSGICIGFDTLKMARHLYQFGISVSPVDYAQTFKPTNFLTDGKEAIFRWLHTKNSEWSYQKEIRAWSDTSGIIPFPIEIISRVYFGNRTSDQAISKTVEVLRAKSVKHIRLSKMEFIAGQMVGRTIAY